MFPRVIKSVLGVVAVAAGAGSAAVEHREASTAHAAEPPVTSDTEMELIQAQVVLRHGWRTPLSESEDMASLPWSCPSAPPAKLHVKKHGEDFNLFGDANDMAPRLGSCYLGQLTDAGHKQMRQVGIQLRERYVPHLFDPYHRWRYQLRASSTGSRRTCETTFQVVQGLVNGATDAYDVDLDVNIVEPAEETMYPRGTCSAVKQQLRHWRHQPQHDELKNKALDLLKEHDVDTGYWKNRILAAMCNTLSSIAANGMTLPGKLTNEGVDQICDLSGQEYKALYSSKVMTRLGIGRFLQTLTHRMHQRIAFEKHGIQEDYIGIAHAHPLPKIYLYGGHDNTLAPLLNALGAFDGIHPPMGSYIAFELYKRKPVATDASEAEQGSLYVKVNYNGKFLTLPGPCQNQEACQTSDFFKMVKKQIPKNYEEECSIQK